MITKVSTMNSVALETECRKMADSYLAHEMTGSNLYRFTRGYFESAIRNGSLYDDEETMSPLNRQWFYRGFHRKLTDSLGKVSADQIWRDAGKDTAVF